MAFWEGQPARLRFGHRQPVLHQGQIGRRAPGLAQLVGEVDPCDIRGVQQDGHRLERGRRDSQHDGRLCGQVSGEHGGRLGEAGLEGAGRGPGQIQGGTAAAGRGILRQELRRRQAHAVGGGGRGRVGDLLQHRQQRRREAVAAAGTECGNAIRLRHGDAPVVRPLQRSESVGREDEDPEGPAARGRPEMDARALEQGALGGGAGQVLLGTSGEEEQAHLRAVLRGL